MVTTVTTTLSEIQLLHNTPTDWDKPIDIDPIESSWMETISTDTIMEETTGEENAPTRGPEEISDCIEVDGAAETNFYTHDCGWEQELGRPTEDVVHPSAPVEISVQSHSGRIHDQLVDDGDKVGDKVAGEHVFEVEELTQVENIIQCAPSVEIEGPSQAGDVAEELFVYTDDEGDFGDDYLSGFGGDDFNDADSDCMQDLEWSNKGKHDQYQQDIMPFEDSHEDDHAPFQFDYNFDGLEIPEATLVE